MRLPTAVIVSLRATCFNRDDPEQRSAFPPRHHYRFIAVPLSWLVLMLKRASLVDAGCRLRDLRLTGGLISRRLDLAQRRPLPLRAKRHSREGGAGDRTITAGAPCRRARLAARLAADDLNAAVPSGATGVVDFHQIRRFAARLLMTSAR